MAFMVAAPLVRSSLRLASAVTARRTFVGARVAAARPAAVRIVVPGRAASSAAPVRMDMESDLRDRLDALYKEKDCMPIMVRLAWHDAGTLGSFRLLLLLCPCIESRRSCCCLPCGRWFGPSLARRSFFGWRTS